MPAFLNSSKNFFTLLFFLIFFLIGVYIFPDYGISIDEDNTRMIGFLSLEYIFNIFLPEHVTKINKITSVDGTAIGIGVITSGIIFDLPMAFLELIFKIDDSRQYYLLRHFFNFFIFFVSVFFFFQLIKKRYNSWSLGILGTTFLLISPRIFANSFYNNKDLIFMSLFIIGLYTSINFLQKKDIKTAIIFAIVSSLMINLRILGLILPLIIFLIYTINILHEGNIKKKIKPLILFLILTPFLIILFWPYLWANPIERFLYTLKSLSDHDLNIYNYYLGQHISTKYPPWHYSFVWILISTPLFYIMLFLIGFIFIVQRTIKRWLKSENNNSYLNLLRKNKELQDIIFLSTFFIPILVSIYFGSISYDGWRHLYFIYPSFLLIAVLGLHLIKVFLLKRKNSLLYILSIILIIPTMFWMYKNHPFQYVYFNLLAGKNFNEKFEMDYFGVSNKSLLEYIIEKDDKKARIYNLSTTDLNLSKKILKKETREKIDIVDNINSADYITNNYRDWNGIFEPTKFMIPKNFKIFYEIKVDGISINTIYKKQ